MLDMNYGTLNFIGVPRLEAAGTLAALYKAKSLDNEGLAFYFGDFFASKFKEHGGVFAGSDTELRQAYKYALLREAAEDPENPLASQDKFFAWCMLKAGGGINA